MLKDMEGIDHASLRGRRMFFRGAVLALSVVGALLAIKSGWDPGPWGGRPWPYPLGPVLLEIAKMTLISLGLYDILRPTPQGSSLTRTAGAAGVLVFTLFWGGTETWTDQPGYAYATGTYVFILTGLLLVALLAQLAVVAVRGLRGRRPAA